MDINLGPAIAAIFILLFYIFAVGMLAGVTIAYAIYWLWFRNRGYKKNIRFYITFIFASILCGYLAVQTLFWWNRYEERKYYERKKQFAEELQREYSLTGIKELYRGGYELTISVPEDGEYFIIWTLGKRDNKYDADVPSFFEGKYFVSKIDSRYHHDIRLHKGENRFVVYSEELMGERDVSVIDLTLQIFPEEPRKTFNNDQKGIAVTNPGSVEYNDGMAYQSNSIYRGDCDSSYLKHLPCVDTPLLHILLTK